MNLYKASLNEIKYYQNELTRLELKALSLVVSMNMESEELKNEIIKDFSLNSPVQDLVSEVNEPLSDKINGDNIVEMFSKILESYKKTN